MAKPIPLIPGRALWQKRLFRIVFESDTAAGKAFDVALLVLITLSVVVVCLDSVSSIEVRFGPQLRLLEWFITICFTVEYLGRIMMVGNPRGYVFSFFGFIDLLSTLPAYLSLLYPGSRYLSVVRVLRMLRIFRILKLSHYVSESSALMLALHASRRKILVFIFAVTNAVIVIGAVMYVVEGPENGFTSIPASIYWAVVTLTTVGYGDIAPASTLGQFIACVVMILGYGVIAVPTGIVTVELSQAAQRGSRRCPHCGGAIEISGRDTTVG